MTSDQQAVLDVFRRLKQPSLTRNSLETVHNWVRLDAPLSNVIRSLIADGLMIEKQGHPTRYNLTDPAGIDACGGMKAFVP